MKQKIRAVTLCALVVGASLLQGCVTPKAQERYHIEKIDRESQDSRASYQKQTDLYIV